MLTRFNLQLKRKAKTTPQQNKTKKPQKIYFKNKFKKKTEKEAYNAIVPHSLI
jgi:hypothetical protein